MTATCDREVEEAQKALAELEKLAHLVLAAELSPRHAVAVPGVYQALRAEHDRLKSADKLLGAFCVADLGRPEYAREGRLRDSAYEVAVVVEVAVDNERIGRGERSEISDLRERLFPAERFEDRLAVERSEQRVILLAVKSRRKFGDQREAPASGVVARVALVELEAVDPGAY